MKTKGNTKLKTTADGLRIMDLRLAIVIALMALNWLYFINRGISSRKAIGKKLEINWKPKTNVVRLYDKSRGV